MALQGRLKDIPLTDLLDLITRNDNAGILRLNYTQQEDYQATVVVKTAQLYFAWINQTEGVYSRVHCRGEEAIHVLLSLTDATFSYELLPQDYEFPPQNIFSSRRELMLGGIFSANPEISAHQPSVYLSSSAQAQKVEAPARSFSQAFNALRPATPQLAVSGAALSPLPVVPSRPALSQSAVKVQRGWLSSVITYIKNL